MKKFLKIYLPIIIIIAAIILLSSSSFTVREDQYACVVRFSAIVDTKTEAGFYLRIPFVDGIRYFSKATQLYDIPESDVLTADKKSMTVDSYVMWKITDPLVFFQKLGGNAEAEARLNAITYNALKNTMGTLAQSVIINQEDASERNDIYEGITRDVCEKAAEYGISVVDVKVKRLDLPTDNEAAVYARMISERNQIAEKYVADGEKQAAIIRNDVDRTVNITVSDAEAEAAKITAEGESEYMRMLAAAYDTAEKKNFFEFTKELEALQASLNGEQKTVVLGKDSKLVQLLTGNYATPEN